MAKKPIRRLRATRKKLRARRGRIERANNCAYSYVRGEQHHKAVLTDHEVDIVLELRSEGWLLREIAAKFEQPRSTIRDICAGLTRYRSG